MSDFIGNSSDVLGGVKLWQWVLMDDVDSYTHNTISLKSGKTWNDGFSNQEDAVVEVNQKNDTAGLLYAIKLTGSEVGFNADDLDLFDELSDKQIAIKVEDYDGNTFLMTESRISHNASSGNPSSRKATNYEASALSLKMPLI
jgi:hypothetical protein